MAECNNCFGAYAGKFLTVLAVCCHLAGCAAGAGVAQEITSRTLDWMLEDDPTIIEIRFEASKTLNCTEENRPSPLVVRFYQLKSVDVFSNAEFFKLYEDDKTVLGDDIQYREEWVIKPGESHQSTFETKEDARFIALFAAFRDLENAKWRKTATLTLNETTKMIAGFDCTAITLNEIVDE